MENSINKEKLFQNLALKAQAGDEENYKELLTELVNGLRSFLYYHLFDENKTEEVLQEILKAVDCALHTYRIKDSFLGWLFAIVEYNLIRQLRRYQKISSADISYSEYLLTLEKAPETLDDSSQELLQKALDNLPEQQRQVMLVLKVKEYYIDDVSIELNLNVREIKSIAYQAYKNLRKELVK